MSEKKPGKELLFEELRARGLTESQIKSKAVAVLLDVIANDGTDRYLNAKEVDDELKEKKEALVSLQNSLKIRKWQNEEVLKSLRRRSDNLEENIKAMRAEFDEYVAEFGKSLEAMETPEARDQLKAAHLFTNTVKIQSKENNTAYIQGLAQILCGLTVKAGLPNGLKPMTRNEFDPDAFSGPTEKANFSI